MKKITEEWLKTAKDDLRVIEKIGSDEFLTHMVAFHSQQSIEKSLKAVIEEYNLGSMRVHNLERLIEIVKQNVEIDVEIELIEKLDKLYVDSRYPGEFGLLPDGKPTVEDAESFREAARSIYSEIKSSLEKQGNTPDPEK